MAHDPHLPTSVDINQLEQAVGWLEQIQRFVETYCVGAMPGIHQELGAASNIDMSDVDYSLHHDATVFGGFYSAYGLQVKHDAVYKGVHDGLVEIAKEIGKTANATKTIIENYKTTEERNRAAADAIKRLLEGGRYTSLNPDAMAGKATDPTT